MLLQSLSYDANLFPTLLIIGLLCAPRHLYLSLDASIQAFSQLPPCKFFTSKPLSAYLSQASVRTMLKKLVQRAFLPNRNRGTVLVLRESASTLKSTSLFVHKIHLFPFSHFPFSEPLFHVPTCILSRPFLFLSILCTVSSKHNPNLELSLFLPISLFSI